MQTILGERTEVLCSHHQAIGVLGRDLTVTARSDDGVIEAVELAGRRFVVGVQWHPEESGDPRLFAGAGGRSRRFGGFVVSSPPSDREGS